jgi:hypothetical protein
MIAKYPEHPSRCCDLRPVSNDRTRGTPLALIYMPRLEDRAGTPQTAAVDSADHYSRTRL